MLNRETTENWFLKTLDDGILAEEEVEQIKTAFLRTFKARGCPQDMALFLQRETDGRLHCRVHVFFSPACASIATETSARVCERPTSENLEFLLGATACWDALTPKKET
ncbi:MAG: hypothetical protein AMXMBFR84_33480 [Candidatus Hydrogenedentota bacterium]